MSKSFNTEAPFVVTAKNGRKFSHHYTAAKAVEAAKDSMRYRVVHGMHRGDWKELAHFNKGERLCLKSSTSTVSGTVS